ncbi:MAG: hypothetical protein A3E01_15220 [Gammaproteobacteria bacterium RIFCSPHIGHO2_12_FULL_63_22]|nr:MAG: hypothetical protein A3E01_15220 [Gammaproteobacteria bacterium RIFCSPHIGHO2_12_FULL_63_22]
MDATPTKRELVTGGDPDARFSVPVVYADFAPAPDLEYIANYVIPAKLPDFPECSVTYLWKKKGGAKSGKGVYGKLTKSSGLVGYFAGTEYVLWLAADHIKALGFTAYQVEALLFHELCHIDIEEDEDSEEGKLTTKGHDIEAFRAEVEHYGFWDEDLRAFATTMQGRLPLE